MRKPTAARLLRTDGISLAMFSKRFPLQRVILCYDVAMGGIRCLGSDPKCFLNRQKRP
jgi:hypothetical protein